MMTGAIRTYSELIKIESFQDRFSYLKLDGAVGAETFGRDRYLNQLLYTSEEWKRCRRQVIIRDNGCDLGVIGYELPTRGILIHHIEPITIEDILNRRAKVFDLDNLICTSHATHNAIHYGDEQLLILQTTGRSKNDTCPWKKKEV